MKRLVFFGFFLACLSLESTAQQAVRGKVTDPEGRGLPGVSVTVKNSRVGSASDSAGNFSVNTTKNNDVLVFSLVGYAPKELRARPGNSVDVTLIRNASDLDEVVVVGYGTVKKSDLTGSVVSISAEQLKATPVTTFDQALQGRAAGVQVVQATGAPGGGTNIRIRGTTSINASSEPLYVIDGLLVNSNTGEMSIGGRGPAISPLATINPSDIESIEILKDASATAIYGSRAANGVVLITTKKGKAGTSIVNLETYYGSQETTKKMDLLNATEYAELVNEAEQNAGRPAVYPDPQSFGKGTDWQSELFRKAPIASAQVSVSGGTAKTRYSVGGGYFGQQGIVLGSDLNRYSFKVNLETDVSDRLTVGTNMAYNRIKTNGVLTGPGPVVQGVVYNALLINPILPVYDPTRAGGYTFEHDRRDAVANPIAEAKEFEAVTTTSRVFGTVYAQYKIIEGLSFRTTFGIDGLSTKSNTFGPNFLKRAEASLGEASISTLEAMTWLNTNTLNYNKQIGANHSINALAGFEVQQFRNESTSMYAFGFPESRTGWHNIGAGEGAQPLGNGETEWGIVSYFGRVNYSFMNKYLFTLTGRVDGSSKFAQGNKYGFFPSAAFAWRVSDERFMRDIDFISDLKLRASYGRTGNQSIAPYQSLATISGGGIEGVFSFGNTVTPIRGRQPNQFPNTLLKWETTDQANLGIDVAILKGRLSLTAEVYQKNTKDLLLSTPLAYTTGFGSSLTNIGNIKNNGVDLALTSVNLDGALNWTTSANVSFNRNEVTELVSEDDVVLIAGNILRVGQPVGSFYGYVFNGIFQNADDVANSPKLTGTNPAPGDQKYQDIGGPDGKPDGIINEFDRTIIGNAQPDFTWGLNNSLTFKNFTLSFFFQGSQGNQLINQNLGDLANLNGKQNILREVGLNRWTPQNPSNEYARAYSDANDNVFSSRFIEDASYLRLKNLTLGYNLPASALRKLRVSNIRLYLSGSNLWTVTDYRGYDPEGNAYGGTTDIVGVDFGGYPQARVYTVGLNVGF